ncbi:MAG: hypothetical protein HY683_02865 [Chloroflexi bacterium]|nr:hypothetical protein [Chloroflexota bacterium]
MSTSTNAHEIMFTRVRLTVRVDSLFFPLDYGDIAKVLPTLGYELLEKRLPVELPAGARLAVSGRIAQKEPYYVHLSVDRGFIGVDGDEPAGVLSEFKNLLQLLEETYHPDFGKQARFYEIIVDATVRGKGDPLQVLATLSRSIQLLTNLQPLLGEKDLASFGLRLVPRGASPGEDEWFEWRIEPLVPRPKTHYTASVVYRSPNRENVETRLASLEDTLDKLVSQLEAQGSIGA